MLTKPWILISIIFFTMFKCTYKQSMDTKTDPLKVTYGALYSGKSTTFTIWSPVSEQMTLRIYKDGHSNSPISEHHMKMNNGVWSIELSGDYKKKYYTYQSTISGKEMSEVTDPYAKAVGVNGKRGMVIDMVSTNPKGWDLDQSPELKSLNDAIIYELHIRDFSIHPNSGIKNKGKYQAFTEQNTNYQNISTGIAHLKDLGVTHIHVLPAFDFRSVDESKINSNQYNWGYDPQNYNVPEGSYSSNPQDGVVRIREFKEMVMALHDSGLRVVMDVVYNHTGATEDSNFNQLYPGYYYRQDKNGGFSNASACGNETASEKPMMRKFIIESVKHWIKEYHIDGFRFDLMGIHDIETMNKIAKEVKSIDSSILLYGEGWTAGSSPLADSVRAIKANLSQMPDLAVFSDEIRDGIKGHWANHKDKGFVSGNARMKESVKFGITAAIKHPHLDYSKVNYTKASRANGPWQTINYAACHDDLTLWDKLKESTNSTREELISMHLLANTIVLTSQGIPFLHAGAEFLRTKGGDSNSYKSPDSINQLNWDMKYKNINIYEYYKQLIKLRKDHKIFRLNTIKMIQERLSFTNTDDLVIAYQLDAKDLPDESWEKVFIAFNGSNENKLIDIPAGNWETVLYNQKFLSITVANKIVIKPKTALILKLN